MRAFGYGEEEIIFSEKCGEQRFEREPFAMTPFRKLALALASFDLRASRDLPSQR